MAQAVEDHVQDAISIRSIRGNLPSLALLLGLGTSGFAAGPDPVGVGIPSAAASYPKATATAADQPGGLLSRWLRSRRPGAADGRLEVPPPPAADARLQRAQAAPADLGPALGPAAELATPTADLDPIGGQSLGLQAALFGALTSNPDLVSLRQGSPIANAPSPEALEVARRFPTTLNPTLWVDYRPMTLIPDVNRLPGDDYYRSGNQYLLVSLRQPFELGHQTTHRFDIARAALDQQRWTVTQAELTALVQTYRVFQTAAYRRERLRVARDLAASNDRLLQSLQARLEANQATAPDAILARVESRAAQQQARAAEQDYVVALTDLRNQIGIPEAAGTIEPLGEFTLPPYIPPVDEPSMIRTALESRPDVHAARAQVRGAEAAVRLARGDRIPTVVAGPQYVANEAGVQYLGLIFVAPLPVVNNGKPLLLQREAEARRALVVLRQAEQRAIAQIRAAVGKWNGATDLVRQTEGLTADLAGEVAKLERLFDESQTDLTVLMQARQRMIQLENSQVDAIWQATQAQADLLLALGAPSLINAMLDQAESDAGLPPPIP